MRTARAIERRGSPVTLGKTRMRKEGIFLFVVALSGCASPKQLAPLERAGNLDRPLTIVSRVSPDYAEVWSRFRAQAEAGVALTIQDDGSVSDVALALATKPDFGRAAVEAVKKWRFAPPTRRGQPVRVRLMIVVVEDGTLKFSVPNQSLEPTPTAGTSAAEQPLVPAAVVAHL